VEIEKNKSPGELISTLEKDPSRLVSSFVRILDSTDSAYKELYKKHRKLKAENRHLKNDRDMLVKSEKMASISQFSMGLAHEINNPISFIISNLNTLSGYIEIIKSLKIERGLLKEMSYKIDPSLSELPFSDENSEKLNSILADIPALINESLEGANRIKNIVRDLMFYKKRGKIETCYANLNDIIESCFKLALRRIEHKVLVERDYGSIPELKCYPHRLKQVFFNLIMNAADAIEKNGTITVKTEYKNNEVIVCFSDTGSGIKMKHLNKIFDPFFTTKEVGQGMGLGLSIVYSIIKQHNGEIDVESRSGGGTKFIIKIPVGKHDVDSVHQTLLEL